MSQIRWFIAGVIAAVSTFLIGMALNARQPEDPRIRAFGAAEERRRLLQQRDVLIESGVPANQLFGRRG